MWIWCRFRWRTLGAGFFFRDLVWGFRLCTHRSLVRFVVMNFQQESRTKIQTPFPTSEECSGNVSNGRHTKGSTVSSWLGAVEGNIDARLKFPLVPVPCLHGITASTETPQVESKNKDKPPGPEPEVPLSR